MSREEWDELKEAAERLLNAIPEIRAARSPNKLAVVARLRRLIGR